MNNEAKRIAHRLAAFFVALQSAFSTGAHVALRNPVLMAFVFAAVVLDQVTSAFGKSLSGVLGSLKLETAIPDVFRWISRERFQVLCFYFSALVFLNLLASVLSLWSFAATRGRMMSSSDKFLQFNRVGAISVALDMMARCLIFAALVATFYVYTFLIDEVLGAGSPQKFLLIAGAVCLLSLYMAFAGSFAFLLVHIRPKNIARVLLSLKLDKLWPVVFFYISRMMIEALLVSGFIWIADYFGFVGSTVRATIIIMLIFPLLMLRTSGYVFKLKMFDEFVSQYDREFIAAIRPQRLASQSAAHKP